MPRRSLGIVLIVLILLAGRVIRARMLIGPDGKWRDPLWLEGLLPAAQDLAVNQAKTSKKKPVLTSPLPINTCSVDSLTLLPRVGKVLASRIDEVRKAGFVFKNSDDLQSVKGIGPAMAAKLDPLVIYYNPIPARAPADTAVSP